MVNEILRTDIPDGWNIKKLEPDVGFVRSGKRLPKGYYVTPIPTQHPYELLAYADTPDEIGEKFRQFELLKEKIVIISNETMYSSGMLAKIFGGKADKEVRNKACTIGTEVGRVCSFFIDEIKKAGSYEEYIKENPEIITEKIGEICEPFKKSLTERIDDAQNKILEIE